MTLLGQISYPVFLAHPEPRLSTLHVFKYTLQDKGIFDLGDSSSTRK